MRSKDSLNVLKEVDKQISWCRTEFRKYFKAYFESYPITIDDYRKSRYRMLAKASEDEKKLIKTIKRKGREINDSCDYVADKLRGKMIKRDLKRR